MKYRTPAAVFVTAFLLVSCSGSIPETDNERPNIVLIMTDDQGWAQLGAHGDAVLQTPHLDKLADESVEMTRFYVSPVCAPTRAALMTGRYNYRTGVVDTYLGRAMMEPAEITIAEMLGAAGYRTGIFGKWHLGDNYPQRTIDQGFQESVAHKGGGIGQPSDPPGSDYFDPILFHNGEQKQYSGYCTDVYFDEAMRWIGSGGGQPFFAYIPTNAPHSPYLVPDSYRERYAAQGLSDKDARIYGMIENIDDNVGKLLAHLDRTRQAENTIFIFMTDNGPTTRLHHAGLRAQKGSVYENGIRAPFFFRWPARLTPRKVDSLAAHIDIAPTLLAAAGVDPLEVLRFDGIDIMPQLKGKAATAPDRTYYAQAHRGDEPQLYRAFAAVTQRYKLTQPLSFSAPPPADAEMELYDLIADPGEENNLAGEKPEIVERMKAGYEAWFVDVAPPHGYRAVRFSIGSEQQSAVTLTRQDWRMKTPDGWGRKEKVVGSWEVHCESAGPYDVTLTFAEPAVETGRAEIAFGDFEASAPAAAGAAHVRFEGVKLTPGEGTFEARLVINGEARGVWFVDIVKM